VDDTYRHRGLLWPILVITAGVLLLLNNLGMLSLDLWELLWRGWPLILIAIGIDLLIGRRSAWGAAVAALLIIAVLLAGLGLYGRVAEAGSFPTHSIERPLGAASSAALQIDAPVVDLSLSPGAAAGVLVEGGIRQASGGRIDEQFAITQGRATLRLEEFFPTPYIFGMTPDWELQLGSGVPLDLDIDSGVGRHALDLRGLQLDRLNSNLGVGQVSLWLPDQGRMTVQVGMGVGQTIVRVPRGLGVRLSAERGMVGLSVPPDFTRSDGVYLSPGYAAATDRVEITVSQGVGLISILWEG
jgi:hypothetical protein